MKKTALIVGISGIVGGNLADLLVAEEDWTIYGLARRPGQRERIIPIAVDLQDAAAVRTSLRDVKPTHIFLAIATTTNRSGEHSRQCRHGAQRTGRGVEGRVGAACRVGDWIEALSWTV